MTLALVFMTVLVSGGGGDVDGNVAGGEKRLHDQRGNGRDERSHDGPFGRLGLSFLDIPGSGDDHGEGAEVGDAGEDAHASTDSGVQAGGLGEDVAAAIEQVSGADQVRIHGYDCTMTRENPVRWHTPGIVGVYWGYIWGEDFRANFVPKTRCHGRPL